MPPLYWSHTCFDLYYYSLTLFLVVVKSTAEVRDNNIRALFHGLYFSLVTHLDEL